MAAVRAWYPTLSADGQCRANPRDAGDLGLLSDARRLARARPRLPAGRGPSRHLARRPSLRRPVAPELRRRPVGRRPRDPAERHGLPGRRRHAPRLSRARLGALLHPGRAVGARRLRPEPALRLPRLPAPEGDRTARAGSDARVGARGPRRRSQAPGRRVPDELPRGPHGGRAAVPRADGRRVRAALRARGRGRVRAPDRVRERREPDADPVPRALPRNGRARERSAPAAGA